MTQDEVIELAVKAGMNREVLTLGRNVELLEAFAKLVVERDRANILAVIGDNQCECKCSEVVRDGGKV